MKNQVVASIAAIPFALGTVFGAFVAPAQAAGSLAFSDGTDHWFSEVSQNPVVGDTFDIEFNFLDINFVSTATGVFEPLFNLGEEDIPASVGIFEYVSESTYALAEDLDFAFNNGVTVTWVAGTQFLSIFNHSNSVQFMMSENQPISVMVDGIGSEFKVIAETFQFSDTESLGGGTYSAQLDVDVHNVRVPEPATLFGLGVVTAGLVASRRQKKS